MAKSRTSPQSPKQRTRGFSRYKRSETSRLVKGVMDAGLSVRGIEVNPDTGALRVLVGDKMIERNSWDDVLTDAEDPKRTS